MTLTYVKFGIVAALLAAIFGAGYHFGGLASKTALEASQAAQLKAVAAAYQAQVLAQQASESKLQSVEDAYDAIKDLPDPVSVGLASRVLYRACPVGGGVPETPTVAGGTATPAAVTGSDPSLTRRLQAVLDACSADARQLQAVIELAPK